MKGGAGKEGNPLGGGWQQGDVYKTRETAALGSQRANGSQRT